MMGHNLGSWGIFSVEIPRPGGITLLTIHHKPRELKREYYNAHHRDAQPFRRPHRVIVDLNSIRCKQGTRFDPPLHVINQETKQTRL
jgi:hypothetical protein